MNKNFIYLSLSLLLFTTSVSAQYKKYKFGIGISPQQSWIRPVSDPLKGSGPVSGFSWEVIGELNLTKYQSLVSGLNLLFNGGKYQYSNSTGDYSRKLALKSIEIPITIKAKTFTNDKLCLFAQAGLGQTFLMSAKTTDDHNRTSMTDTNAKAAFLRESLIVGGGLEYSLDAGVTLGASLLFDNGFTNVLKGNIMTGSSEKQKGFINTIGLSLYALL